MLDDDVWWIILVYDHTLYEFIANDVCTTQNFTVKCVSHPTKQDTSISVSQLDELYMYMILNTYKIIPIAVRFHSF